MLLSDPRRGHPVAGFGWCATGLEELTYRDSRPAGAVHAAVLIGAVTCLAATAQHRVPRGWLRTALTAMATWVALGGTTLARTGSRMADLLDAGDLDGARDLLPSLCGRDPSVLDTAGLARAACESVAENTSDAQVAPLLWAAAGGVPGAGLPRRQHPGRDDRQPVRPLRPIRLGGSAVGRPRQLRPGPIDRRPGAGVRAARRRFTRRGGAGLAPGRGASSQPQRRDPRATFAGALGVRLGGPTQYRYQLEIRPSLGEGPAPVVADLRRAVRLSRLVQAAALLVALAVGGVVQRRRP